MLHEALQIYTDRIRTGKGTKFFIEKEVYRSVKCSALSHIKSADPVKIGTPSACFPLQGKRTDFFYFEIYLWSAKFPHSFLPMGKFTDLDYFHYSPSVLPKRKTDRLFLF
jgi:hypothetical protein